MATASESLWLNVQGSLDYTRGVGRLEENVCGLSQCDRLLLEVAINLFYGKGRVDLAELVAILPVGLFEELLIVLIEYRFHPGGI